MRTSLFLASLISALSTTPAEAAPRRLTLADAVHLALIIEPVVEEARIQNDRAKLGVLRAQLDRFTLTVDASIGEQWNKVNIGGPTITECDNPNVPPELCGAAIPTTLGTVTIPGKLVAAGDQAPSMWTGLSNLSAQLNYFVFSGFRVEANVKRAQLAHKAATVQIRQQQKDTALAVARSYWNLRRLTMMIAAQRAAVAEMSQAETAAAAKLHVGLAPPVDKNRAAARKLQQQATLDDLEGQADRLRSQLGVTLDVAEGVELVDDVDFPDSPPPPTADELVSSAWARRPEVVVAKLQLAVQHQQVRMAQSNFYPQLTVFGLYQYGNNPLDLATGAKAVATAANPFLSMSGNFTFGGSLNMNFFDTLHTYTSSRDAQYEEKRLVEEVRRSTRQVDSDVRGTHAALLKLYARRQNLIDARDVERDNLKIIESRYRSGDSLIIEYLDAAIDLANSELQLADVTAQLQLQWLELHAAMGDIVGVDHV